MTNLALVQMVGAKSGFGSNGGYKVWNSLSRRLQLEPVNSLSRPSENYKNATLYHIYPILEDSPYIYILVI